MKLTGWGYQRDANCTQFQLHGEIYSLCSAYITIKFVYNHKDVSVNYYLLHILVNRINIFLKYFFMGI